MNNDEKLEIIDAFENDKKLSDINNNSSNKNKLLISSIVILPILCFIYFISLHSNKLINMRLSIFILILISVFLTTLILGVIREFDFIKRLSSRIFSWLLTIVYVSLFIFAGFLLYGNNGSFRDFIIDKSMMTKRYKHIVTWFYDSQTISESLSQIKNAKDVELDGSKIISFDDVNYNQEIYENEYEEAILKKDQNNDLYKIIEIDGVAISSKKPYKGYLVAVYDPSKVKLITSEQKNGAILLNLAQKNNAKVAINASGFATTISGEIIPYGAVIKDGKKLSEYKREIPEGGLIGFTNDYQLVLKRMTPDDAIKMGIKDAIDGGPYLIINGKNQYDKVTIDEEVTAKTAIAQRKDGIVLFLVIDNYERVDSYGISYTDIAQIMQKYGAINAACLDSGSSSSLVVENSYVNNPSNGNQMIFNNLPNAWGVIK